MTNTLSNGAAVLILITLFGYSSADVTPAENATNSCTDCYQYNGNCNVTSVGYAVPLKGRTDMTLVQKLEKGDIVIDPNLQCVNHGYKVAGIVFDHICFWNLPSKCEAVIPTDTMKNKASVRTACRSCAQYCHCSFGKNIGSSIVSNIYILTLCSSLAVIIKISMYIV